VTDWYAGHDQTVNYTERYIPDDVLIQLILLMMSTGLLETRREVKLINTLEKCVKLVINKNYPLLLGRFPLGFPTKIFYSIFISSVHATGVAGL
jgi:hypothetical protein